MSLRSNCASALVRASPISVIRWRNVLFGMYFFQLCRRKPERAKQLLLGGVRMALGKDFDVETHFTPRYNPWQQRLCLVPDGDLFRTIREGRASVVTNHIDTFTEKGIRLKDGSELEADMIVTATGLNLQGDGRHVARRRRQGDRAGAADELQGHDVFGRPEPCHRDRLHQRLVDAEMRSHLRICLPPAQPHGQARLPAAACRARPIRR